MNPSGIITGLQWMSDARSRFTADPAASIVFAHIGKLDHHGLQRLIKVVETSCDANGDTGTVRKRLINVVVEGLENLHRHPSDDARASVIALLVCDHCRYRFATGNAVPAAIAAQLNLRLDIVNQMDDAELKEQYLKVLSNSSRTGNGGAGLGLFTMARRCERPITVRTTPIDGTDVYFGLELSIARN